MLQRSALYSELSVVVMPLWAKDMEISYSAVGADRRDYDAYQELFRYNRRYASLVASGHCVFLPRRYTFDAESTWGWSRSDYVAPLLQDPTSLTYLPANLQLGQSPYQDLCVYETFLLPYFPEASLDNVATIAQKETNSFVLFNRYLTKQLSRLSNLCSSEEWSDVIEEIRSEVARLHIEAKKVARSKLLRNAQIVMFAVSIGAVLGVHNVKLDDIAGILGSVNLLQMLQGEFQRRDDSDKLRQSEFFVPYLLSTHG
jgi:hypothetical protein